MQPVAGLMRRIGRTREFVQFYSCMHVEHTLDGPRICIREHGRGLYSIMELPQWLLNHGAPKWFYCLATTYHCCADRKRSVLAPRRLVRAALAFVWSADGSLSSLLAQVVLWMHCKGARSQNTETTSVTWSIAALYIVGTPRPRKTLRFGQLRQIIVMRGSTFATITWTVRSLVPRPCAFVACSTKFAQRAWARSSRDVCHSIRHGHFTENQWCHTIG